MTRRGVLHHSINTNCSHLTECERLISSLRDVDYSISAGTFIGLMVYKDKRLCRKCAIALLRSVTRHVGDLTEDEQGMVES